MGTRTVGKASDKDDNECVNVGDVYMGDFLKDDIHEHEGKKKEVLDLVAPLSTGGRYRCCRKSKSQIAGGRGCEWL
jgi:hypothetical protein